MFTPAEQKVMTQAPGIQVCMANNNQHPAENHLPPVPNRTFTGYTVANTTTENELPASSSSAESSPADSPLISDRKTHLQNQPPSPQPLQSVVAGTSQETCDQPRDEQIKSENWLEHVIDQFDEKDVYLQHHLAHKAALSVSFLGCAGVVRWLGLPSVANLLGSVTPLSQAAIKPLAIAVTSLSFLATNLLSVYSVNHMPFEGITDKWQILSGTLALFPTIIDSIAGYAAMTALGLSSPVSLLAAAFSALGAFFYYWHFSERIPYILKGQDDQKEQLAQRAEWLQKELQPHLTQLLSSQDLISPSASGESQNTTQISRSLAERLTQPQKGEWLQRLIPFSSKAHKIRNIISELKTYKKNNPSSSITVKALRDEAVQARLQGCRRIGNVSILAGFAAFCTGFTWSDNGPTMNSLLRRFYPALQCRTVGQTAYYSGIQLCGQVFSIAETTATALLSLDNVHALKKSVTTGLKAVYRQSSRSDIGIFVLGLGASLCYSLTIFGAVQQDLHQDPCLSNQPIATWVLPVTGAIAGILHTWLIGIELKGVKSSVKNLGYSIYRSLKANRRASENTPLLSN